VRLDTELSHSVKLTAFWDIGQCNVVEVKRLHRLGDRGSIPTRSRDFSLRYHDQTNSGTHVVSYPVGNGVLFRGLNRPGHEDKHSLPSSTRVKNVQGFKPGPGNGFLMTIKIRSSPSLRIEVNTEGPCRKTQGM
jgi:hypothetical protein